MKVTTHVDFDVVAVEQDDEVTVMLEIVAPSAETSGPRPTANVEVVLDRSGSMHGERLGAALLALDTLVGRLSPEDRLGIVTFDSVVEVPLAAQRVGDGRAARAALRTIYPRGMTNLSGGLLRGLQEAQRVKGSDGATILLVSDGHANDGIRDAAQLASVAATSAEQGITTTTIGIGEGYDEALLAEVARGGRGSHAFAIDGDGAGNALAGEVDGLLERTVQAASLTIRPEASVDSLTLWNDLPTSTPGDGVIAEIGDLWSGETRKLVMTFAVPAKASLGLAKVATLELRSVALPSLEQQTVTLEVHVNVVPGDQAAGRVPDPVVHTELLAQKLQRRKLDMAEQIARGDIAGARATLDAADDFLASAPMEMSEAEAERRMLGEIRADLEQDARFAAKRARSQHHQRNRKPGREE
jgi:Ca-activated chloride channel family protein